MEGINRGGGRAFRAEFADEGDSVADGIVAVSVSADFPEAPAFEN